MSSLGQQLRQEREKKGLTLEQVQDVTKIRLHYLKAIEDDRYEEFPGEVYLKGFLRSYAEAIGLDGAEVIGRYQGWRREADGLPPIPAGDPEGVRRVQTRGQRAARRRRQARTRVVAGFLVVAVALLAIGGWALTRGWGDPAATRTAQAPTDHPLTSHAQAPDAGPTTGPKPQAAADTQARSVNVVVEGRVRSWISVSSDGKATFQGFLSKGQRRTFVGSDTVEVTFTNAGGVLVTHNGVRLGVVGETGRVVTRTFGLPRTKLGKPSGATGTNASLGEPSPVARSSRRQAAVPSATVTALPTQATKVTPVPSDSQTPAPTGSAGKVTPTPTEATDTHTSIDPTGASATAQGATDSVTQPGSPQTPDSSASAAPAPDAAATGNSTQGAGAAPAPAQ